MYACSETVDGPEHVSVNHGFRFTGGEQFCNFNLLESAVETAEDYGTPSTFVETNAVWCVDNEDASFEKKGLEWVPFRQTKMAAETGYEMFGRNVFVNRIECFCLFTGLGSEGTLPYDTYKKLKSLGLSRNIKFFFMIRTAYRLGDVAPRYRAASHSCDCRDLFSLLYPRAPGMLIGLSVEPSAGVFIKHVVKTQGLF